MYRCRRLGRRIRFDLGTESLARIMSDGDQGFVSLVDSPDVRSKRADRAVRVVGAEDVHGGIAQRVIDPAASVKKNQPPKLRATQQLVPHVEHDAPSKLWVRPEQPVGERN